MVDVESVEKMFCMAIIPEEAETISRILKRFLDAKDGRVEWAGKVELYEAALRAAMATVKYHMKNKIGYSIPEVFEFAKLVGGIEGGTE